MRKPKIKTYKNFQTCSKAAERLNGLALLCGVNKHYVFLCYAKKKLVNGKSVTIWYVASKDYITNTDGLLYVVNSHAKHKYYKLPFHVRFREYCNF